MVIIAINKDEEMLDISKDGVNLFYGNYWDFDRPQGIIDLLKALGIEHKVTKLKAIG